MPKVLYKGMTNIGEDQIVYNGELEGLTEAIELASIRAKPNDRFLLFGDN